MTQAFPYLVCTLAGTLLGALIAWILTHIYARQALRDARRQREAAERLSRTLTDLLTTWENQGHIELTRDAHGVITGGGIRIDANAAPSRR
jgi:uncharacterized membrane protein YccC